MFKVIMLVCISWLLGSSHGSGRADGQTVIDCAKKGTATMKSGVVIKCSLIEEKKG